MIIRFLTGLWVIALVFVGFSLYHLKYEVLSLESEKRDLKAQMRQDHEAIRVLKAEWAHLNNPERLQVLVDKYLVLHPLQAAQIQIIGPQMAKRPVAMAKVKKPDTKQKVVVAKNDKQNKLPVRKVSFGRKSGAGFSE